MTRRDHIPLSRTDARKARARWGAVPRTPALALLHKGAPEEEWLQARRQSPAGRWRLGASELAAVLGESPHTSPFALWWAKQETWVRPDPNAAMTIGHKLEDVIGELWAEKHPEMQLCRPGSALYGLAPHPDHDFDWLVCTPDFLAVVGDFANGWLDAPTGCHVEPVECKSDEGGTGWGAPGSDQVPEHHRVQVYVQCEILGAPRGHLMRLAGKRATSFVLPYGQDQREELLCWLVEGDRFLKSLYDDNPPDVDGHASTTSTLQRIHAAYVDGKTVALPAADVADYLSASERFAEAKAARDEARNVIRAALKDAQIGTWPDGKKVVKRNIYKRRGYEVAPTMVDELRRMS